MFQDEGFRPNAIPPLISGGVIDRQQPSGGTLPQISRTLLFETRSPGSVQRKRLPFGAGRLGWKQKTTPVQPSWLTLAREGRQEDDGQ